MKWVTSTGYVTALLVTHYFPIFWTIHSLEVGLRENYTSSKQENYNSILGSFTNYIEQERPLSDPTPPLCHTPCDTLRNVEYRYKFDSFNAESLNTPSMERNNEEKFKKTYGRIWIIIVVKIKHKYGLRY